MASRKSRGPSAFLLLLVGVAALLTGWTAMNFRGGVADEADLDSRNHATGTVRSCEEQGPLSLSGVGYWWKCEVDITADGGKTDEQVFTGSQFTPADIDHEIPLASAGQQSGAWARADVPGQNWAIMVTAGGLIVGVLCLVMAGRKVMRR